MWLNEFYEDKRVHGQGSLTQWPLFAETIFLFSGTENITKQE
jgi:hypothetical protein